VRLRCWAWLALNKGGKVRRAQIEKCNCAFETCGWSCGLPTTHTQILYIIMYVCISFFIYLITCFNRVCKFARHHSNLSTIPKPGLHKQRQMHRAGDHRTMVVPTITALNPDTWEETAGASSTACCLALIFGCFWIFWSKSWTADWACIRIDQCCCQNKGVPPRTTGRGINRWGNFPAMTLWFGWLGHGEQSENASGSPIPSE